ncbi:MAG: hypothetical protein JWR55_181 [Aeromicrobium sp.]|nr:hypothetical protein [Aeromicrobium sp.]
MLNKCLLAATSLLFIVTGACGNSVGEVGPPAGLTGISVTEDGSYVIDAYVCRDKIDTVQIVRDRQGLDESDENPIVRTDQSAEPMTGRVTLSLANPGSDWSPSTPTAFEPGKGYIVSGAATEGADNETSQVNITTRSLEQLKPGPVYTTDDPTNSKLTPHSPAEFEDNAEKACA